MSTLSQVAATAAYLATARLQQLPGLSCHRPEGTFVLFPDVHCLGRTRESLAAYLLEEARVAVVPGAARWFGPGAEGHLRLSFATSERILP